jgi:RNA polymerase sigma factor (sigma-70 family)
MTRGRTHSVLDFLRGLVSAPRVGQTPDRQLLERFTRQRDEAAFAELVRRHAPVVLGVCRRLLSDPNDAEDAFQATFLVLVRKAGALTDPEAVGAWLYGVACRTARKARAAAARRRAREKKVVDVPAPEEADLLWRDLRPVLDEEVNRLPARYRLPFVLCYLQGKTNEEAARQLGCPKGTVLSRLSRARERLRARLVRRGVALSTAALATVLAERMSAATVPAALLEKVGPGLLCPAAGAAAVSARVLALTEGVLHAMFVTRLKIAGVVVLTVILCAGAGLVGYRTLAKEPPAAERADRGKAPRGAEDDEKAKDERAEKMRRLLADRVDAAREEWDVLRTQLEKGRDALSDLGAASQRLLVAEREATDKKADHIAAWEAHFRRMKEVEEIYKARFDAGASPRSEYARARYFRLDAEIGLERAKGN